MFIRQNGKKEINQYGENIGWNDAPFYWPVLLTQKELRQLSTQLNKAKTYNYELRSWKTV